MSDSNSNFSIPSTVPKLNPDGTNWHLFKILFANFMDGHVLERLYKPESYPAEMYEDVKTVMDMVICRTIFFELLVFFTFTLLTILFAY